MRPDAPTRGETGRGTAGCEPGRGSGPAIGVDWGATLAKVVVRRPDGGLDYHLLATEDSEACRAALARLGAARAGVTGGGAAALARALGAETVPVNEFAAWGAGASALLAKQGTAAAGAGGAAGRYLLVSLGTGTSVLLVDGMAVSRVGGTALGGGTLLGLAAGLIGTDDFDAIAALARRGSRRGIDLLVSDIYRAGGIPLAGDLTASNFGKLARRLRAGESVADADLASALMGLLGENVALVCAGLAAAAQVSRIVFGGSTLRDNPALVDVLGTITRALGREPVFLERGEFAGALGALLLTTPATRNGD